MKLFQGISLPKNIYSEQKVGIFCKIQTEIIFKLLSINKNGIEYSSTQMHYIDFSQILVVSFQQQNEGQLITHSSKLYGAKIYDMLFQQVSYLSQHLFQAQLRVKFTSHSRHIQCILHFAHPCTQHLTHYQFSSFISPFQQLYQQVELFYELMKKFLLQVTQESQQILQQLKHLLEHSTHCYAMTSYIQLALHFYAITTKFKFKRSKQAILYIQGFSIKVSILFDQEF
ncbi:hypothetical protein TTHERM_000912172 (macronuclear) [Tetrahymena thermophila SB210]|uniref:Uncharacterized protein n=1 Tax=Tetrahymena thermophila (strain SB210) TaxID=312017 RepID=W7X2E8_TETTS|nr:hypothetical protein TTHERM_000912172 [Tetrahymena thermophila SB210]EWS73395.1 hypothetical protein TTHERM_000912172 [Tetrahymena thermophila SB210]|eukprot:XP_012654068.1 hypothetical protein TTHERM_000912172 [Tetrahymena thermophila SB210]